MSKAIALFSGGLDSTLAILAVLKQEVEVVAVQFITGFEHDNHSNIFRKKEFSSLAEQFGFTLKLDYLGNRFIDIIMNPKHGYGKNMNPCIDCRILMLRQAKDLMSEMGATFIVTGEVLGQRPMSQRKEILYHIDKKAGLSGYVLRPLSAKLLNITFPEEQGLINREKLYDFRGRPRKPQIALAEELGLKYYPAPAGGCLLTDPIFSYKIVDLLKYNPSPTIRDFELLKVGRHFRISSSAKIIVGRNKIENEIIESLMIEGDSLLKAEGFGSPSTLLTGEINDNNLKISASLCARYSDAKNMPEVAVSIFKNGIKYEMIVKPADRDTLENYRIK
ncbi:MAG: 7-cyano-7-deazaguanine synthase [Nitrospirae bacterium]|nr:7-cyano-7-deazaguanine synthase [Nitrospirota bacterium]